MQSFSSPHGVDVRNQLNGIHRETVLGKYIIPDQKTDKTLFSSVVIFAAPEISKGTTPDSSGFIIVSAAASQQFFFHFRYCSTEILYGGFKNTVLSAKSVYPTEIRNPKALMHFCWNRA